jgi:peptidoglycan/LPS O-acetylase OafA/YrhL
MVALEQFYLLWLAAYGICLFIFSGNQGKGYGRAERVMAALTFAFCLGSLGLWIWDNGKFMGMGWRITTGTLVVYSAQTELPLQLPLYASFLALGMLLYWAVRQKIFQAYFYLALVFLALSAGLTGHSRLYKTILIALVFIPLSRGYRLPDYQALRFLAYCGRRAYSIYLVHAIIGIAFLSLTWRITAKSAWLALPLTLGAIVLSLLAGFVFYRLVELPCHNISRSVEYRRRLAATGVEPVIVTNERAPASAI